MQFEGIWTPIVTPSHDDHSINEEALAQTVEYLIQGGVHGIISAGTTGEYYAQSHEERIHLAKTIKTMIDGRVPLVMGTGALRTEESIEFAKAAKEIGADALLVAYKAGKGAEIMANNHIIKPALHVLAGWRLRAVSHNSALRVEFNVGFQRVFNQAGDGHWSNPAGYRCYPACAFYRLIKVHVTDQ